MDHRRVEAIDVRADDPRHRRPVPQAGAAVHPGRGVGHHQAGPQAGLQEAGVHLADEVTFRPVGGRRPPGVSGDLQPAALPVERVLRGIPVVDLLAAGPEWRGLQPDMPQDRAGPEEDDVHAAVVGGYDGGPLGQ